MPQTFVLPKQVGIIDGTVAAGSVLKFYRTLTNTPQNVYTDSALTNAVVQITADAAGVFPKVYLNPNATADYRVSLEDGTGVETWAEDDISRFPVSSAEIGAALYPATDSEDGSGIEPTNLTPVLVPDIERYGASTTGTATANTAAIQRAIDANYGKVLRIPYGTYQVATTGSTTAPVGDALTITDEITIVIEGQLVATNNCNIFNINAGSQDVVSIVGEGSIKGHGTFYELTNYNGAPILVTAGIVRISDGLRLIDPPQYAIRAMNCPDGMVSEIDIIGGQATYPGDNNYGICLIDGSTGWKIDGCRTLANALGGKVSQAVASLYFQVVDAAAHRTEINNCRFLAQWEKGTYMIADDTVLTGCIAYGNPNGEGFRVVGARTVASGNKARSCVGGGFTMYDGGGSVVTGNDVTDCSGAGYTLAYAGVAAGKSLSFAKFHGNNYRGKTGAGSDQRLAAFDIRGHSSTSTTEQGIELVGNTVVAANQYVSDERAAFDFLPQAATLKDLRVEGNSSYQSGAHSFRFRAGTYSYCRLIDNKAVDPGQSITSKAGFRWEGSVTWVGGYICRNEARADSGSAMAYGFDNNTESGVQSVLIEGNHSRGHVTAGMGGLLHTSNVNIDNRMGDNSLHVAGYALTAAASFTLNNSNARTGMLVRLHPTNASAALLQGGADALYFDGTVVAGTSFTLKTRSGSNAAGTETFNVEICP
jgi:hypothetical protein